MKATLTALFNLLSTLNPTVAAVGSAALAAGAVFNWINSQWALLISKLDSLSQANFGGTLQVAPFSLVNTFVPLSEAMSFFTAWVGLALVCVTIRIVKSLIPTVAS